jgi:quinol monooxygenase YgiN
MIRYGLHGKIKSKAGSSEKLAKLLLDASTLATTAKGCRLYFISKEKADPDTIWITEVWDSKEDHDNSLKDGSIRALISQAMPLIEGVPEMGQELEILGGLGI